MTRQRRILLATLSAAWAGMLLACGACGGGGGQRPGTARPGADKEAAEPARPDWAVQVAAVRLEPVRDAAGQDTLAVCVDWTNVGDNPVRSVRGTLRVYTADGRLLETFEDRPVYESRDPAGVAPDAEYRQPAADGVTLHPGIARLATRGRAEFAPTQVTGPRDSKAAADRRRKAERKAEQAQAERQRKAEEAEAERKRKEEAEAERRRKAEEEHDADGLVLLRKTVKGVNKEFGGEITGTVVNRRGKKLRYAQVTFILYDKSGAQIGTAVANINDLEADGRWNFKASSLGREFHTYKFSELSGF